MSSMYPLINKARTWLAEDVFPLWTQRGIDPRNGSFVESLSRDGEPMPAPRRAMVQARQIYSFCEGARMGILPKSEVQAIVRGAIEFFIASYSLANGGIAYSVTSEGKQVSVHPDLYTQAFALFGMAEAFHLLQDQRIKERALQLLQYLQRDRRLPCGGYSELVGANVAYEANPHMHLYEAAVVWMKVDRDPRWQDLTEELDQLCRSRFIDVATGALSEHCHDGWKPIRENGEFVWEPGHHYEWAWLMAQYAGCMKRPVDTIPFSLFRMAEEVGRGKSGIVFDEVWSGGKVKRGSARFWPQGERVKAAVALGAVAPQTVQRVACAAAADQAFEHLFTYFEGHKAGLWGDVRTEAGVLDKNETVKASSLYHIVNAMSEYERLREKLG